MTEPGGELAAGPGGAELLAVTYAREQVIRTLKVALAQGRLTEDEHDARAAQATASRSEAELAALTADLPAGLAARLPEAGDVWTGVGVTIAAVGVLAAILVWQPDTAPAFMALILAVITLIVAPVITVGLIVDLRHRKRSGGRLPPRPTG